MALSESHALSKIRGKPNHELFKLKLVRAYENSPSAGNEQRNAAVGGGQPGHGTPAPGSIVLVAVLTQDAVNLGVRFDNQRKDYRFNLSEFLGNDDGQWCRGTKFEATAENIRLDISNREKRSIVADLKVVQEGGRFNEGMRYNLDEVLGLVDYLHPVEQETYFRLGVKAQISPRRTLILCFDGTSNHFSAQNTNVVKMFELLKKDDPERQMVYYQTGVGTYTSQAWTSGITETVAKTLDEGVAWYLYQHIIDGYKFLMETYRDGDRICIFGFSRGAYTARALAGMLHCVGLLPRHNVEHVPFAYEIYASGGRPEGESWWQSVKSGTSNIVERINPFSKENDDDYVENASDAPGHELLKEEQQDPDGIYEDMTDNGSIIMPTSDGDLEQEACETQEDDSGEAQEDDSDGLDMYGIPRYGSSPVQYLPDEVPGQDRRRQDDPDQAPVPDEEIPEEIVSSRALLVGSPPDVAPPKTRYDPWVPENEAHGALGEGGDPSPKNTKPEAYKKTFCSPVQVDFVGVWDTVGSVGAIIPRTLPHIDYNPSILVFRHALALDEHRANFVPSLWDHTKTDKTYQDVREVWFRGQHSDVGGGSPPPKTTRDSHSPLYSKLCNIPLRWMVQQCLENKTPIAFDHGAMALYRQIGVLEPRPAQATFQDYTGYRYVKPVILRCRQEFGKEFIQQVNKGIIPMPELIRNEMLYEDAATLDRIDIVHQPYESAGKLSPWNILEFAPSPRPYQADKGPELTHWPNLFKPREIYRRSPEDPIYIHSSVVTYLKKDGTEYKPNVDWRGYKEGELPLIETFKGDPNEGRPKSDEHKEALVKGLRLGWNKTPGTWDRVKSSASSVGSSVKNSVSSIGGGIKRMFGFGSS